MAYDDRYARSNGAARGRGMSICEPYLPEGFDEFWNTLASEAFIADLDYSRSGTQDYFRTGFKVETYTLKSISGMPLHGWLAYDPAGAPRPGFLWLPPYGRWSMTPNEYGTREGYASVSINYFGGGAFHEEAYSPHRGYFSEGVESPETWVFRRMIQDTILMCRMFLEQPEVESSKVSAMGLSQGGGMAIWLASVVPQIRCVVADFPFLSAMPWVLSQNVHRYPLRELFDWADHREGGKEEILNTIAYFDTVNVATRCRKATLLCSGLRDPAVKPEQVEAVYEALPGKKEIREIDYGHDWHPSMVQANKEWLDRFGGGDT